MGKEYKMYVCVHKFQSRGSTVRPDFVSQCNFTGSMEPNLIKRLKLHEFAKQNRFATQERELVVELLALLVFACCHEMLWI